MVTFTRRTVLQGTAVGLAAAAAPKIGFTQEARGSIVIATPTYAPALDPILTNNTPAYRQLYSVYDSLLAFDFTQGMALKPALAESWNRLDDRTVEFKLRQGVRFHDGSEMTAEDVVFTFSPIRTAGPGGQTPVVTSEYQNSIDRVEAVDPLTVRIITTEPDPVLEQKLASWTGQIMSQRAWEAAGGWDNWLRAPVGAGPYKIETAERDVRLVLVAHDEYWGGRPPFERIEYRIVPEQASRINGLVAGDYDLITDVLPDQFSSIEGNEGFEVVGGPIPQIRFIIIDSNAPWLSDVRFRRALSLAINRDAIVDSIWGGRTTVPNGAQNKNYTDLYIEDFPQPRFDPEEARRLLQEAGYAGEAIPYRLQPDYYAGQVLTAQILVEMWRDVGINVEIQPVDNWSQVYAEPVNAIFDSSSVMAWPDPTGMTWRSIGAGSIFQKTLGLFSPQEFNKLGELIATSTDLEERRQAHRRMLELVDQQDVPAIVLYNMGGFYGKRADVDWQPYESTFLDFGPANPSFRA